MAQNYTDNFGLYNQYGIDKAWPENFGEYQMWGPNRIIEGLLDLTGAAYSTGASTSSTVPTVISNTSFFPAMSATYGKMFIEKIEITCEEACASGTSWNLGLIQTDRTTIPSGYGTGLIAAEVTATFDTAGKAVTYINGTSKAGTLIGTGPAVATGPYLLTSFNTGTFTTGKLRVRIHYHPIISGVTGQNIAQ